MNRHRPPLKNLPRLLSCLVVLSCFPLLSTVVSAQTDVIEEKERRRLERQKELDIIIQEAAKEAKALKALEAKVEVTYEQILADPDNLDLNFRYAKSQVARGEWIAASTTLERILMLNPDLAPVRLFNAIVLYQLDNLEEAEREFIAVSEYDMPEEQREQVEQYLHDIRRKRQKTQITSNLSLGWGIDSNRNSAASSKRRLALGLPVALTGTSRRRRDTNFLLVSTTNILHDLGLQAGHQLFGSFTYYLGEQTSVDDLDLQSFSLTVGPVLNTPLVTLTPTASVSYVYLSRESFLRSNGLSLRGDGQVGERLALYAQGGWTRENYIGIIENTIAPQRTGDLISAKGGGRYALSPTSHLNFELGYEKKSIRKEFQFNAYEGLTLSGGHTWILPEGQFVLSGLDYTIKSYDVPDLGVSTRRRGERQLRIRFTYGAPVALFLGEWLPASFVENVTGSVSLEQFRALSNITNYTYSNTKFNVVLSKRFDF